VRIGYARVSTRDQHPEAQADVLHAAGCERVSTDKASGKLARRPELDEALRGLRAGDQLVVTKLDRLGRSLEHLIELSNQLQARGVDLVVLDQGIDTSTALGRMFSQILGSIAEFEDALMAERTRDGLAAARARGRTGGQKPKLGPRQVKLARCTTRPARTANASTPSPRSPLSSPSPAPPSTATSPRRRHQSSQHSLPHQRRSDTKALDPARCTGTPWRPGRHRSTLATSYSEVDVIKKILEFLALKWLWDRRRGRR